LIKPYLVINNRNFRNIINTYSHEQDNDFSVWSCDIKYHKNGTIFLVFGSNTHYIRCFRIPIDDKNNIQEVGRGEHRHNVPCVSISPDCTYISSVSIDGHLYIWDMPSWKPI